MSEKKISYPYSFEDKKISKSLQENLTFLKPFQKKRFDFQIFEFSFGKEKKIHCSIIYCLTMCNADQAIEGITTPLLIDLQKIDEDILASCDDSLYSHLKNNVLPTLTKTEVDNYERLFNHVLSGDAILLIDGCASAISFGTRFLVNRAVTQPDNQTIRGPKDAFTEAIYMNVALLRKRIRDPNLTMDSFKLGRRTKTDIIITYIEGIADEEIVENVYSKIKDIDVDSILESGYIEEFIQEKNYSPFPTVYNTEKPDVVAGALLEGQIGILVDNTPFVLIVPSLFVNFLQSPEDYYQRSDISSIIRILRYICFFISLLTPAFYIAISTFHQEMIPPSLLVTIISQREGVPLSAVLEATIMEVTFEILREAGIRMPKSVGSAISIVGALVIGEAAVHAGIVSPLMVIVVATTAISNFVIPSYNLAISVRMLKFLFIILSGSLGLYGITIGLIFMIVHLSSLTSFGVPYLSSLAPFNRRAQQDAILRFSHRNQKYRPSALNPINKIRQKIKRKDD